MTQSIEKEVENLFRKAHSFHVSGDFNSACNVYFEILKLDPNSASVCSNLGAALVRMNRFQEAIHYCDKAIALDPQDADPYHNRGTAFLEIKEYSKAIDSYNRAITLNPKHANAYTSRGAAFHQLKQYQTAIENYNHALHLNPDDYEAYAYRMEAKSYICLWDNIELEIDNVLKNIQTTGIVPVVFPILPRKDVPAFHHTIAKIWINTHHPFNDELGKIPTRKPSKKIRIGYFSSDFKNHAVSSLTAELFELHNRDKFEVFAFALGAETNDVMRQRLVKAFDYFIEVRSYSDKEVAQLTRQLGIDIAIDLNGFTAENRMSIFSYRAAPIQINYLGYPGTTGAEYIDYIISDPIIIPPSHQKFYSEKVIYLPYTYMPSDRTKVVSDRVFTRAELGLPETGFIFCCFNNNYKITPTTFDGWMRILHRVPGSVLWLAEDNSVSAHHLRQKAV